MTAAYVDVARLGGRYHLDPYVVPPAARRHDDVFVFVHWRHAVTDYGPLFTLGVRPLGRVGVTDAVLAGVAVAAAVVIAISFATAGGCWWPPARSAPPTRSAMRRWHDG
jgi:hypothetical protein